MTYELAKKLKKAGFPQPNPQELFKGDYIGDNTKMLMYGHRGDKVIPEDNLTGDEDQPWAYIPTLSELIEACEPYFKTLELVNYLNNTPDTWFTIAYKLAVEYRESGQTAEEAMANLWLKLNAK